MGGNVSMQYESAGTRVYYRENGMKYAASGALRAAIGLGLAVVSLLPPLVTLGAPEAPQVSLTVEAGYSGYIRPLTWVPLRATLSNAGDAAEGELVVDGTGGEWARRVTAPVSLPRGGRRQVFLYAPGDTRSPSVRFVSGKTELASAFASLRAIAPEDRLVVAVSDPPDAYNFLGDIPTPYGGRTYVAPMRAEQLPDRAAALDSVDVILIANVDASALSVPQRAAIEAWLVAGGHLILAGGPGARLAASPFAGIAPAQPSGSLVQRAVAPLAQLAASRSLTTVAPLAGDAPMDALRFGGNGLIIAGSPAEPLVARRDLGRGMLDQLAFDAGLSPLRDWRDRTALFAALFEGRVEAVAEFGQVRNDLAAVSGAGALPATSLPSFGTVVNFLIVYAVLVGPLNLFVLRRLRRTMWMWVTVPALSIAFAVIGLALGLRLRGSGPALHRASLVYGDNRVSEARSQGLVGVYSPRLATLTVDFGHQIPQSAAPAPEAAVTPRPADVGSDALVFSAGSQWSGLQIPSASVKPFVTRGEAPSPLISASADYRLDENPPRISVAVRNDSDGQFQDCVVASGRNFVDVGGLAPGNGAQASVQLRGGEPRMRQYGLGLTYGYGLGGAPAATRPGTRTGPFDNPGNNVADMVLARRVFYPSDLREAADRGLVGAFFSPTSRGGEGMLLMCWETRERAPTSVDGATYVDRGLRIWRLGLPPFQPARGQKISSEMFEWSVAASSSTVGWTSEGLLLNPGAHVLVLRPWTDARFPTTAISATLRTEFTTNSPSAALTQSLVSLYDWNANRFGPIRAGLAARGPATLSPANGDFVSPSGEIIVRFDIVGDAVTLNDIDLADLALR